MKEIIIEGNRFNDINGLYTEIDRVITKDMTWRTGHNLDSFNDLLRGGFGVHEFGESIVLIWENANKSKEDLGYSETVKHYENMLIRCHPTNRKDVSILLENAKQKKGDTLFEIIIHIIKGHEHIELITR